MQKDDPVLKSDSTLLMSNLNGSLVIQGYFARYIQTQIGEEYRGQLIQGLIENLMQTDDPFHWCPTQ